MKTKLLALALTTFAIAPQLLSAAEPVKKLLVVSTTAGYRHSSIPTAEKVLTQLGEQSKAFTLDFVRQPDGKPTPLKAGASPEAQAAFKAAQAEWEQKLAQTLTKLGPDSLKNYDGVIFVSTSGELPIPDKAGFLAWIRSGKAFIGMHAASDTFANWPEYVEMIGGSFDKHGPQVGVECLNRDPAHPATRNLGATWPIPQDEIYQFKSYDPARVHELLVLDKHPNNKTPGHFPVAWCRDYGSGKVFYTSLGHREDIWDTDPDLKDRKNPVEISQAYQAHILGGIKWALGLEAGPKL
jgi:uncharacterized protein